MISLRYKLGADDDVDCSSFHRANELGGTERRPNGVGRHDCRARLREQLGDLVGNALDAGPACDKAVRLPALGTNLGGRHHMTAMMACKAVHQPVLDHPCGAVRAVEPVSAVPAQGERGEASTIKKQ